MSERPKKVFKVVLSIVDFDELGEKGIRETLENTRFPNDCIYPKVRSVESREVLWHDDHPLNKRNTSEAAFEALFKDTTQ